MPRGRKKKVPNSDLVLNKINNGDEIVKNNDSNHKITDEKDDNVNKRCG